MSDADALFPALMGLLLIGGAGLWMERDDAGRPAPGTVVALATVFLLMAMAGTPQFAATVDPLTGGSASHVAQGVYGGAGLLHGLSAWLLLGRETLGRSLYLFGMPLLTIAAGLLIDRTALLAFVGYAPLAFLLHTPSVERWLRKA